MREETLETFIILVLTCSVYSSYFFLSQPPSFSPSVLVVDFIGTMKSN